MTLSHRARAQTLEERLVPLKRKRQADTLLVHEIYRSIQGESTWAGVPCVFVRLTGCHLRCVYCDTEHAFADGQERTVDDVVREVNAQRTSLVELTGGEPLLQPQALSLVTRLLDDGHIVLIETSGAVGIEGVDPRARIILDIKTPGSGEHQRNLWKNLERLKAGHDEVKLVIVDDADYAWARQALRDHPVPVGVAVLFSPAAPTMDPKHLAELVVRDAHDGLDVRFQLQLHKVLWGDKTGV